MIRRPDSEEIAAIGRRLGFDFNEVELKTMSPLLTEYFGMLEAFDEMDLPEERLPMRVTRRDPGYRPSRKEDPLNAFISKCRVEGAAEGPLVGKTVGLKDHIAVAGVPLTLGSRFFHGYVPDFDATIVTRLLDAGATIVGKLNMEPFSTGGATAGPKGYGRVLNPHDNARSTGGSSSGSGAAVAHGDVDIAFGGDQGGSIRLPSSWCGVVGIKATFGLIPHTGVFGSEQSRDHVGPMTKTVDDLAVVLACVAGPDGYDPRQAGVLQPPEYPKTLDRGIDGLRVGLLTEGFPEATERDVDTSVREAIALLEKQGAKVSEVSTPVHSLAGLAAIPLVIDRAALWYDTNFVGLLSNTYSPTSFLQAVGKLKQGNAHELPLRVRSLVAASAYLRDRYHGRFASRSENLRKSVRNGYDRLFEEVDVLAMPTVPIKAPPFEEAESYEKAIEFELTGGEVGKNLLTLVLNTFPFNYTGHPAMSVPCAKSEGLPVGIQLVARHFEEEKLLRTAYALQSSLNWEAIT